MSGWGDDGFGGLDKPEVKTGSGSGKFGGGKKLPSEARFWQKNGQTARLLFLDNAPSA